MSYEVALQWFQILYKRSKQLATRWTWCYLTLGAHSTQRTESAHSGTNHSSSRHTLTTVLAAKIEEYLHTVSEKGEGKASRIALRNIIISFSGEIVYSIPVELDLSERLSPCGLSIVKFQMALWMNYSIENITT